MDIVIGHSNDLRELDLSKYSHKESFYDTAIYVKEVTTHNHYFSRTSANGDVLYIAWGLVFEKQPSEIDYVISMYEQGVDNMIENVDADILFFVISKDGVRCVVTDRVGINPVFYRTYSQSLVLSTEPRLLMKDYSLDQIDYTGLNDYLRFGTLIGDHTLSKYVKLLQGGSVLCLDEHKIIVRRSYIFHHNDSDYSEDYLIKEIETAICTAIRKRLTGREKDTCLFLSGGMDSRMLLAAINKVTSERITTVSFGQKFSEEVDIARKCAEVYNNPFLWIEQTPAGFIKNANEYEDLVCGSDMFQQGYIIDAAQNTGKTHFISGTMLGAVFGGTFLNSDVLNTRLSLAEYIEKKPESIKMKVFTEDLLSRLFKDDVIKDKFPNRSVALSKESAIFEGVSVANSIQAFTMNARSVRLVFLRDKVPSLYMDSSYILNDVDFLKAMAKVPARLKVGHAFYQKLFMHIAPEYANIPYNNTTLPISAPIAMWKSGSKHELEREEIYESLMREINQNRDDKIYYPHYYSDFNGYSRYDIDWANFFQKYILTPDSLISQLWFDYNKIQIIYNEHISCNHNYRKELIYLTSLELFLRNFLNK